MLPTGRRLLSRVGQRHSFSSGAPSRAAAAAVPAGSAMTHSVGRCERQIFRLVLTGGPCGGKTTGQARLCTFFENLGWKVYRVPETASVLLSGGIRFTDLNDTEAFKFQENLLRSMVQIENTFFTLAESSSKNCLVICDRGTMDASAFVSPDKWDRMLQDNGWNPIELRDNRYNMIIHMVTAANGAEEFYTTSDHACRSETLDEARYRDTKAAQAWIGHPYFDVIDNSTEFDGKLRRMITTVCQKLGLDTGDRLSKNSRKVKFLIGKLAPDSEFPPYQDFKVVHDYLVSPSPKTQSRLRKRGQNNHWSYTSTIRRLEFNKQTIEVKTQITSREYQNMLTQRDTNHYTIYKLRRCFLWNNQYFQLDIYMEPCHPRCKDLVLLETYTTLPGEDIIRRLPSFLEIVRDVTGDPTYSMYTLSRKDSQPLSAIESKHPGRSFATQTTSSIVNGHSHPANPFNGVDH